MTNKLKVWYFAFYGDVKPCKEFIRAVWNMPDDLYLYINNSKNEWHIDGWYGSLDDKC